MAAVVSVIVEDFLPKLLEGIELGLQYRVQGKLRKIHDLLCSVREVLPEAENKYGNSLELQDWVRNLKLAAFDAEDLLEELFMEEALWPRKREVCRLFRAIAKLMFGWRMRRELRDVVGRLQDLIRSDKVSFIRNIIPAEIGEVHEVAAIPFFGRDVEKRKLTRYLSYEDTEQSLPVIEVNGPNWYDKMAPVREVCSEFEFDVQIWVNESLPFDEHRVAQEIVASLTNDAALEEENVVRERLLHRVTMLLDGRKKYLFVLEDLSITDLGIERWLRFKRFLNGGAWGSKILVMERYGQFATLGWGIHRTVSTWEEEALALLLKTASKGGEEEISDPEKLRIAKEIVKECPEIPWIIRTVGEYLSLQHAASDWSRLRDMLLGPDKMSVLFTLFYGGYPYNNLNSMVKRYNNLPPRIKQCFTLCSLFPEYHAMEKHTLATLWIALGYIKPSSKEDHRPLEDIADDYFNRLLGEDLFQVKKFDISGNARAVMLHPDAEDLVRSVAGCECWSVRNNSFLWYYRVQNPRHISVTEYWVDIRNKWEASRLRTFLHFIDDPSKCIAFFEDIIPLLNRTRVLDLHGMNKDAVPEGVWKLKLLKYLDLSGSSKIKMLPPAITGLLNLQTLKLSGCSSLKELPRDMRKMVALRHLYIDGCWKLSRMPKGLGDLKSLNILTDFILPPDDSSKTVDSSDLADLCKLENLRGSLRITNLGFYEDERIDDGIKEWMNKNSSLESVELRFMNLQTDTPFLEKLCPNSNLKGLKIQNYGGSLFPEWMTRLSTHLPNLVEIALIGCENCEYLPQFGQLRHLKSLIIQGLPDLLCMDSGSGQCPPDAANDAQPFGDLSSLCIRDCPKLKALPMIPRLAKLTLVNVSEELFRHPCGLTSLKTLRLENIELLHHLPKEWLQDLTGLREIHIRSCPLLASFAQGMRHLEKLESLSIWNCKELDLSKDEHGNDMTELQGLKSLKFLTIYKASKMVYLPLWLSHVTTLIFLCIRSCPNLAALPEQIGSLQSLKLIELVQCPRLTSLPVGMDDFTDNYPRKLNIVGCPLLKCNGVEHSRRL